MPLFSKNQVPVSGRSGTAASGRDPPMDSGSCPHWSAIGTLRHSSRSCRYLKAATHLAQYTIAETSVINGPVMHAERWEPVDGIDAPIDHIDFSYSSLSNAAVTIAFLGSAGSARTLALRFTHVIVIAGEDEAPGGFVAAPAAQSLPKLERGSHPTWTFPLLRLLESPPLNHYQMMRPQPLAHFYLVSLHNLVHVIASADVAASWLTS